MMHDERHPNIQALQIIRFLKVILFAATHKYVRTVSF